MRTTIQLWDRDGVTLVELKGRLTRGEEVRAFREAIDGLLRRKVGNILLDLDGLVYLDANGLGELLEAHARVAEAGCQIKLLNSESDLLDPLQARKLFTVFEVFADEATAFQSFGNGQRLTACEREDVHTPVLGG